jgi:hydrogenase maturation protease
VKGHDDPGAGLRIVVAGIGSEYRRDDGAGPAVAAQVADLVGGVTNLGTIADPFDLLGLWDGADLAVVVDAVRSGAKPGTVRLVELDIASGPEPVGDASRTTSTHGMGLTDVFRLAQAVGTAPGRVVVVGIEGSDFAQGTGLSPAVARSVPQATRWVAELIGDAR